MSGAVFHESVVTQARGVRVEVGQQFVSERAAVVEEVALERYLINRVWYGHDGDTVRWRIREVVTVIVGMSECVMDIDT